MADKTSAHGTRRTGSSPDIVQGKLRDTGVELQEKRQRLANAASGTENGDLGELFEIFSLEKDPG